MSAQKWLNPSGFCSNTSVLTVAILTLALLLSALPMAAQSGQQAPAQQVPPAQQGSQTQKPQQQAPPEAGGPQGDVGPFAVPKKTEEPAPPPPPRPKAPEGMPQYSLSVDVPVVSVDALVVSKEGNFIPGLKKEYFRVLEDGVPQTITSFTQTERPITAVLLIEFSNTNYEFMIDALNAAYAFAAGLKKDDWVAVIEYDMHPTILVDFTQDKSAVMGALNTLRVPGFRESNVFDALYDTLDRIESIEGRKEIILVGSGRDTFSRITYDKMLKRVKDAQNVTIFTVSTGRAFLEWVDARAGSNYRVREAMMDYLQADNQMNTFAKLTGGKWYNPRFQGEFPDIFRDVAASVRNQYTLTYKPTNAKQDGTYRKLKVELVAPGTDKPLVMRSEKGKEVKYNIVAREGYTAKRIVE
ncbi:MAG TPA: VWA domain-containing protein [Clostridia bacterium]|nr:VWA domain-containing protein [Clostridia bacterium]